MKKYTAYVFFLVFSFLASNLASAESTSQELANRLNKIIAFESNYEQIVSAKSNKVLEEARGKFYLGNNKAFKNTIDYPEKSAIISDGEKLWMIDYELDQVSLSYLKDYLGASPLALLLGDASIGLESFTVTKSENTTLNQSLYQLKAKDALASILAVRLGFKGAIISFIELDERSGNKVRINFSNISELTNTSDVFKAVIPEGFDVIDETKSLP